MGGEQSRPGTVRVPPPSIMPAGGPPGRGTVGGPMFVSPEHLLDLMASGHPFLDGLSHSQPPPGPLPSMVHAQQVRCDAVVDGESLRVTPSPEDPSRLHLDFTFTAHSPVEVGVTYLCICRRGPLDARPLTHPTALLSRLPKSTRRHLFQAGPKQHFSQLALAQGTPSWLILDKEVEGGVGGETTPSTSTAPAPAPAPATAAEVDPLAGEFLDLRQCTLKEVTHRPRSFAGCVDLLPPLTAPLPPIPPPAPQFKLGEAFLPTTFTAVGKKVGEEEPSIPLDMSPILLTLTVLDESGAPAVPTRLQATLATLVPRASSGGGGGGGGKKEGEKGAEAGWDVKILVQLFQVGSQVYKTQTLFGDSDGGRGGGGGGKGGGGEGSGNGGGGGSSSGGDEGESGSSNVNNSSSSSSSSSSSDDTIKGTDCVICLSEPRTTALLPCRHLALCAPCAQQLRFQSNKCPICRSIITSLLTWGE